MSHYDLPKRKYLYWLGELAKYFLIFILQNTAIAWSSFLSPFLFLFLSLSLLRHARFWIQSCIQSWTQENSQGFQALILLQCWNRERVESGPLQTSLHLCFFFFFPLSHSLNFAEGNFVFFFLKHIKSRFSLMVVFSASAMLTCFFILSVLSHKLETMVKWQHGDEEIPHALKFSRPGFSWLKSLNASCVISDKSLNLSDLQFAYL